MERELFSISLLGAGLVMLSIAALLLIWIARSGQSADDAALGIRTLATQASEEAWLLAHQTAWPWMTRAWQSGLGACAAAVVVGLTGSITQAFVGTGAVMTLLVAGYLATITCMLIGIIRGHGAAKRLGEW